MSKIEQNGKTSLRRPRLLIKEVKGLMKKKKKKKKEKKKKKLHILKVSDKAR